MPAKKKAEATGQTINIEGGVHAGRDVIMKDQYNYGGQIQLIANVQSQAEFVAELRKVQAQLAALKQQPALPPAQAQLIEVVEGQVKDVTEEAQKPKPAAGRMLGTLTAAKTVMDSLASSLTSAVGLGTVLGTLAGVVMKLFGG